jgi:hypothetical protein
MFEGLRGGPAPLAFSHRVHVGDEQLDCVVCHEDALAAEAPGMPWPDTCAPCHEVLDEERPAERHALTLFDGEAFRARRASALADEVRFSHLLHTAAEVDCADCHAGIAASERIGPRDVVSMDTCVRCHAERAQPVACATCHERVDTGWAPASHLAGWTRGHGPASRGARAASADRCDLCHQEASCAGCHQEQPPRSHTNTFRRRTHGVLAGFDRRSCETCHRADACEACHAEARPTSHRGTFGGTQSTHCLGCHLPLAQNGCSVCHAATPSHALATPKPDWHTPAMNCRQCHGLSAPLPHVDKGDDCNGCHL